MTAPKRVAIKGERGRWLASVEARMLPVIHQSWRVGNDGYFDPMKGVKIDGARYREFADALRRESLVVIQRDVGSSLARDGYIGVFSFANLLFGDDGSIQLTLTGRYASPRN